MKILFLDQSGSLGGAELCLGDLAAPYRQSCLVGLFADGTFRSWLEQRQIPVRVLASEAIAVRKSSSLWSGLSSLGTLIPLIGQVARLSRDYDVIYANTQKALVVGAIASALSHRPLVYHLHDILSPEHFSASNRRIAVTLANRFATNVIANSRITQAAFVAAGGRPELTQVIYNGFLPEQHAIADSVRHQVRTDLGLQGRYVVGQFSRLSPWKGQHVLLNALKHCPEEIGAIFVGEALFGEQDYKEQLHQQVTALGLTHRVQFLGFRADVPALMAACDAIAHTSTAAEPFGRVIVEGMLCGRPVIATQPTPTSELIEAGITGWIVPPNDAIALAEAILDGFNHGDRAAQIALQAQRQASQTFHLAAIQQQVDALLTALRP